MQNDKTKYNTFFKSIVLTYKNFGFLGFYRGLYSNISINITQNAL